MAPNRVLLCLVFALASCGGDREAGETNSKTAAPDAMSPDQYRRRQLAVADSVLNESTPVAQVVERLGDGYAVGPAALRDTIARLAHSTNCFKAGHDTDPYLAGTVSILARMAGAGIDLIQVWRSYTRWTSRAGELVNACFDSEAKKWKLDMRYGKPAAYIVQVQFK